jgi:hypothetical protein
MILVMPLRAFGQLNLQRRRRLALMGIFMVGGVAVLASIVRLYALWVYSTTKDVAYDAIFVSHLLLEKQTRRNANMWADPPTIAD